jgi:cytochrome c biogenesis protein CcmG/thiol:disulfide interchange protein DsbE
MDRPVEGREPTPWLALLMDRHVMLALVGAAFAGLLILKAPSLLGQHASLAGAEFKISPLEGLKRPNGTPVPGFSQRDLAGGVTVVNVWGSWCPHCREEHGALMELSAARKVKLVGLAVHDKAAGARSYLQENGIPYDAVGLDEGGRVSRLLGGVSGVPTTLVIDSTGTVVKRLVGGLSRDRIATELMPALEKAWTVPHQKRS